LAGTEDADYPFWSPDSRSIGFTGKRTTREEYRASKAWERGIPMSG